MPLNPFKKLNTIDSIGNAYSKNGPFLRAAAILPVGIEGEVQLQEVGIFLLNPSSITESKSANWAQHNVPGQSDPVMQWTSSGARTLNFQALVTADTSDYVSGQKKQPGQSAAASPLAKASVIFGSIASNFFKVAAPQARFNSPEDGDKTDLDISLYLNYYRSLLYPVYDKPSNPRRLQASPPLVVLLMGKAVTKFPYGSKITSQHDLWVVTNLEINITKFLPNLAPMEAVVTFQLTQYNVRSFDRNRFLGKDE